MTLSKIKKLFDSVQTAIENWFQKDKLEHDFIGTKISIVCMFLHKAFPTVIPKITVVLIPLIFALTKELVVDVLIRKSKFNLGDVCWTIQNPILLYFLA